MTNVSTSTTRRLRGHLERSLRDAAVAMEIRHKDLGARIAAARKAKQWKQKELAAAVHVEPTTVSRWETGAHAPDVTTLGVVADALGVPIRDLLPDADPHPADLETLRSEIRDLRDAHVELVRRIDRLLAERDRPSPGIRYRPEDFSESRPARRRPESAATLAPE